MKNGWGNIMNEELYLEILEKAEKMFKTYNSHVKGQQLSNLDTLDYWICVVAYTRGFQKGYNEAIEDEHN